MRGGKSWGLRRSSGVRWGTIRRARASTFASCAVPISASTRSTASHATRASYAPPGRPANAPPGGASGGRLLPSVTMEVAGVERFFCERFGLTNAGLGRVLGSALARHAGHADLYFGSSVIQTASLEEGVVKHATRTLDQGVGVRVLAGARSGYAYSDEVSLERLEIAARTARLIAEERGGTQALTAPAAGQPRHDLYPLARPPVDTPLAEQTALLLRLDAVARAVDPAICNVLVGIGIEHRVVLMMTSGGALVGDVRPLVRLHVTCIAQRD